MADDLSLVRRKRGVCRSWLTKTIKNAGALLEKDDVLKEELEVVSEDIIQRLTALNSVQEEIQMLLDEDELESDIEQSDCYCREANETLAKVRHHCNLWHDTNTTNQTSNRTERVSPELKPSQGNLPKIDIGKFSGEFSLWQPFYDKFTALIDNTNLPNVSKFTYLQSFLEGDAQKAIEGLSLTNENYRIALDILKTRFGRKERIVYGHIQKLLAIDFQNSNRNVKHLWNVFNELQSNIRSLETLGVDGINYGLILTPLIVSRLPSEIRLLWARQSHEKEADLDFLMDFLQGEIENRERSQSFEQPSGSPAVVNTHRDRERDFGHHHQRYSGGGRESRASRAAATGIALNNSVTGRESCCHKSASTDTGSFLSNFETHRNPRSDRTNAKLNIPASKDVNLCAFCSGGHESYQCRAVFKMDVDVVKLKFKENSLCCVCMRKGHMAKRCYSTCQICKGKHNELFCNGGKTNSPNTSETEINDYQNGSQSHVTFCQSTLSNVSTVLQTLVLKIKGIEVNILFDSGSDKSFITSNAVNKLKPQFVGRETIRMSGFGSKQPSTGQVRNVYGVTFDLNEQKTQKLLLTEVESISAMLHNPKIPLDLLSYFSPHCKFSQNTITTKNVIIDILIGQDYYWQLIDAKVTVQSPSGLVAQKTHLGLWVLSGAFQEKNHKHIQPECRQFLCLNDIPESNIRKLWDLDYLECDHDNHKSKPMSNVLHDFEKKIFHIDGRYEVALPWVEGKKESLQRNAKEALLRLQSLEKKLSRDQSLKEGYDEVIKGMEEGGIIEEVKDENSCGPVFYLPHRPVVKSSSSTTKIRPVFDASAVGGNGVSLNDCMETGPNLLPLLSDILIRFRRHKIAISADIEKAFLQISICPEDRDVHRFFWKVEDRIRTMRIKRVPFGNKSSPFLLNATVRHHLLIYDSESRVVQELSRNMYVDDWLSGGDTVEEVLDMASEASAIMSDAGMKLTKWSSNSLQAAENIQRSFQDKSVSIEMNKVLGVRWNPGKDALTFDCLLVSPDVLITKRLILSCIARIFDPLGLISPFVVSIKILFQEVWELGLSWDEQVPNDMGQRFSRWASDLTTLQKLSFVRSFVSISWKEKRDVELYCFCDASLKAYGAVVYIKVFEVDGSVSISLILSKAKVSPLKPITLPRLELLGTVIGAKLVHSVRKALELPSEVKQFCWTDSTVALHWVKSDPTRWKMFVCNRVVQIQEVTAPECWSHCIGKENPADMLNRGLPSKELLGNLLWFHGPPWLADHETMDNRCELSVDKSLDYGDISEEDIQSTVCLNKTQTSDGVLETQRWGDFSKAVRIVAWIFRFVNKARRIRDTIGFDFLCTDELQFGNQKLLWYIQRSHFGDEIEDLSKGKQVKKESVLHNIRPFLARMER